MSTILTREWGGVNGESWSTVGWEEIVGGAFDPIIQSGTGYGPATGGTDLLWRATGFPQLTGHKVLVDATWLNAAGAGRILGILLRCLETGQTYSLDLDSNVGTTRCRIRRRASGGAWTDLVAWASPAGIPASAALNAGVTLKAVVQNTDADEVTVSLYYGATLLATYTDTSASRIESGGGAGLFLDTNWTNNDIVVDNFLVQDFEDDYAGGGTLSSGVAIVVDGTYYAQSELVAAGITPTAIRDSIGDATAVTCVFETQDEYYDTNSILYAGAMVKVLIDGTVVAAGRLRLPRVPASTSGPGQSWELVGPTQLAADVPLSHPDTGESTWRWNLPTDHVEYDSTYADKEIGEAIAQILDNHVDGDGNLREQGAAPPDEDTSPYVQAQLDAMDAIVPELSGSGDPYSAIEEILSHTKYVLRIDPDTLVWNFIDRTGGTLTDVDQADGPVVWELMHRMDLAYTAIQAVGARPEVTEETLTTTGGDVDEGWEAAVEAGHDASMNYKNRDSGAVDTTGTSGGKITMTPAAITMDADEWLECVVEFTSGAENGNQYSVFDNSTTTFILNATAWTSGGPAATDTFIVYGNARGGGRDNGHREVGRRWLLNDLDKGVAKDACALVKYIQNGMEFYTKGVANTPDDGTKPAEIIADVPAVGLVNYGGTIADTCTEGNAQATTPATVEITVPTYSRSAPAAPKRRYPTSGFTGTSYTYDSGKWSGGGKPGRGDPSVMRTYSLSVPGYDGSAAMQTEIDKVLQALMSFLSPIPREVRIEIRGQLDTTWAGLNRRLTISNTGGSSTGLESATDLFVYAVEYDPVAKVTTLYAGTQGSGSFSPEAQRKALLDRNIAALNKESRYTLEEIMACLSSKPQEVGQIAPTQVCADQVVTKFDGGAVSLDAIEPESFTCEIGAPSTPSVTCTECGANAPLDVSNALTNAGKFQGGGGGAIVKAYDPKAATYNAAGGENALEVAICCLAEHVQEIWISIYTTGKVLNDIAKVNSDESDRHCTQMNALRTAILALQTCITTGVAAGAGVACPITDPGEITDCDICTDYCSGTIPSADACLDVQP